MTAERESPEGPVLGGIWETMQEKGAKLPALSISIHGRGSIQVDNNRSTEGVDFKFEFKLIMPSSLELLQR